MNDYWATLKYYRKETGEIEVLDEIEINNKGEVRYKNSKNKINISYTKRKYPTINFSINNQNFTLLLHVAIISSFSNELPTTKGYVVDHIDKNILNFNLSNLRFVNISENNKNKTSYSINKIGILITDKIEYVYKSNKELKFNKGFHLFMKNKSFKISLSMTELTYNYLIENLNSIFDLLNNTSWTKINNQTDYELSNLGVLRRKYSYGYHYTIGSKNKEGYLHVTIPGEKYSLVHSLVAKIFINENQDYSSDKYVDHIDTNPKNNKLENLRLVTASENMNNKITKKKLSCPIKCIYFGEIKYFRSQKSCAEFLSISKTLINRWILHRSCSNPNYYRFSKLSEEEIIDLENGKLKFTN